ncbi:hypothetical protein [Pollutibacter soli]|uniref:hypothetical protein n=1 Tax=Pollutibacter soli TaxID=3034157 RepID=UPI0030132F25
MRKMLLPVLAALVMTACKKEMVSDLSLRQAEIASSAAAKGAEKIAIWHVDATTNTWKQMTINANAWPDHQAHGDIWKVGQEYKGGKIGYILQAGDPGYDAKLPHGLIAAAEDLLNPYYLDPDPQPFFTWAPDVNGIGGFFGVGEAARGTAIGTGLSNTNAIVQYLPDVVNTINTTFPWLDLKLDRYAAVACRKEFNGYNDWFLPSRDELQKILQNRMSIGGFPDANGPFRISYWSSTEHSWDGDASRAYLCYYDSGTAPGQVVTYNDRSIYEYRARPVRYF